MTERQRADRDPGECRVAGRVDDQVGGHHVRRGEIELGLGHVYGLVDTGQRQDEAVEMDAVPDRDEASVNVVVACARISGRRRQVHLHRIRWPGRGDFKLRGLEFLTLERGVVSVKDSWQVVLRCRRSRHLLTDPVRLALESVTRLADLQPRRRPAGGIARPLARMSDRALLDHMGQLMGEQPAALGRSRGVGAGGEDDVAPDGVGPRMHGLGRRGCAGLAVHAYVTEVVPEAGFHERAGGCVERLAAVPQRLVDDGWGCGVGAVSGGLAPHGRTRRHYLHTLGPCHITHRRGGYGSGEASARRRPSARSGG